MNEKRFIWKCDDENCQIYDTKKKKVYFNYEVVDLLNEQQATINKLEQENRQLRQFINKGRRLSVKELMDNTNENELLKKKIKELEKENKQLRNELNDCEKFRYAVFKRMGEIDK